MTNGVVLALPWPENTRLVTAGRAGWMARVCGAGWPAWLPWPAGPDARPAAALAVNPALAAWPVRALGAVVIATIATAITTTARPVTQTLATAASLSARRARKAAGSFPGWPVCCGAQAGGDGQAYGDL
jgi:hypothetical protein